MRTTLALLLICGCNAAVSSRETSDRSAGHFVRPDAPNPLACAGDGDCAPGPAVDPQNGCCDSGVALGLYGRPYLEWRAGWRAGACVGVTCPAQPSPAQPRSCALTGACVAGRCQDRCSGP